MKNIIVILGTRPEAIKLAPVILELRKNPNNRVFVCNTEQQKELSNQTLGFFGIRADFNLDVMRPNQTLAGVQSRILTALSDVYQNNHFDATIVQGDTMTVFCGALVSFYNRVPVFHVEAGLRSYDLFEPFPEEAMRQMTSRITDLHFAPTQLAYDSLIREGISPDKIKLTGNTVIDALSCLSDETIDNACTAMHNRGVRLDDKLVLVTAHRRENHGQRLDQILDAVQTLTAEFPDQIPNVILTAPLDYPELVCIMRNTKLVLTDSGGIQEEAPTFGAPVLVMRYETERTEGVTAGFAKLVGADTDKILENARAVLGRDKSETRLDGSKNPYGDGKSAQKIDTAIGEFWK